MTDLEKFARDHMKDWATRLANGTQKLDPVEDTAEEVWASLRIFADQYVRLADDQKYAVDVLDSLVDTTFLLVHLVEKGYRTDEQVAVVRIVLKDAMAVLREQGEVSDGCDKCGSRHPESSNWHASHCT